MNLLKTKLGSFYCDENLDKKMFKRLSVSGGHDVEEIELLCNIVPKNSEIIDIGAHIGTFSIPLSKCVKTVHAFEPLEKNVDILKRNIVINSCNNINVYATALAHKKIPFMIIDGDISGNTYIKRDNINESMYTKTLDSFDFSPSIIKIDVEGFELKVLLGAINTIQTTKPILHFEFVKRYLIRAGNTVKELDAFLKDIGYTSFLFYKNKSSNKEVLVKLPGIYAVLAREATNNILSLHKDSKINIPVMRMSYVMYVFNSVLNKLKRNIKALF